MKRLPFAFVLLTSCFSESDNPSPGSEDSGSSSSSSSTTSQSVTTSESTGDDSSSSEGIDPDTSSTSSSSVADESTSESSGDPITDWAIYFSGEPAQSTEDLDLALGTDFTVEGWVRVDSADATGSIVSFLGAGTSGWSLGFDASSDLVFSVYDNNGALHQIMGPNAAELSPGWRHIAAIKSGASLFIYIDGDLDATTPTVSATSAPTVALVLGGGSVHGPASYFALDDLRISNERRYEANFVPQYDLAADTTAQIRMLFDEATGSIAISDGVIDATFNLGDASWTEGAMP